MKLGMDVNIRDIHGLTPLAYAAGVCRNYNFVFSFFICGQQNDHIEAMRILVELGATINVVGSREPLGKILPSILWVASVRGKEGMRVDCQ